MNRQQHWLHEHLNYEFLMLRYTHQQLQKPVKSAQDQLVWNAYFGAFAVYARNLYLFLTNDNDARNFKARDYADFDAEKEPLKGIMNNLHEQVFHPGKQRTPPDDERRVGLRKVNTVSDWVEKNMEKFIGQLKEPYASIWTPEMAEPERVIARIVFDEHSSDGTTTHAGLSGA